MASSLWASIDPTAQVASSPSGIAETSTDPSRQTIAKGAPFYSPEHPDFVFGLVLAATFGLAWYVFEHGAGGGVSGRVGRHAARVEADLEGNKK